MSRIKAAGVAGLVSLVASTGLLAGGGGIASADVTSAAGNAYGVQVLVAGTPIVGPTAFVSDSAVFPETGYPLVIGSALPVIVPGILSVGAANAGTQAFGLGTHEGTVISTATVASVIVGANAVTADAIATTCTANGDGVTGTTELVNATAGGETLLTTPLANTVIEIPGIGRVTLNEQIPFPDPHTPGVADLIVNGMHIELLPGVVGPSAVDVILAHSECHVAGPDVNQVTTTLPPDGTTTLPPDGTTTLPPDGTTTLPPDGTTTLPPDGTTTTIPFSSQTTLAGTPGGPGGVVQGALARTGAMLKNGIVWALFVLFLGGLALLSSRGEVETWPPRRRSSSKAWGPRRSSSTWPKNRPGRSRH